MREIRRRKRKGKRKGKGNVERRAGRKGERRGEEAKNEDLWKEEKKTEPEVELPQHKRLDYNRESKSKRDRHQPRNWNSDLTQLK